MPETIEAEVIEIDGKPPPSEEAEASWGARYGEGFKGQVLRLDRRWWPLWLLLGGLLVVLLLTVGVVLGGIYLVFTTIMRIVAAVLGIGAKQDGTGHNMRRY